MAMIVCPNCGGQFDENEPKCPYCGTMNEEGAEKEYVGKLENLRKELDVVDNEAEDEYKAHVKTFFKTFGICLAVILAIIVLAYTSYLSVNRGKHSIRRKEAKEMMHTLVLYNGYEKEWNELYEKGDYETLAEKYAEVSSYFKYDYVHKDFVEAIKQYLEFEGRCTAFEEKPAAYTYARVLDELLIYRYQIMGKSYLAYSEEEEAILYSLWDEVFNKSVELLEVSSEELEAFINANSEGYPSYGSCQDFAEERWGE